MQVKCPPVHSLDGSNNHTGYWDGVCLQLAAHTVRCIGSSPLLGCTRSALSMGIFNINAEVVIHTCISDRGSI
jgi:hypothetical protein